METDFTQPTVSAAPQIKELPVSMAIAEANYRFQTWRRLRRIELYGEEDDPPADTADISSTLMHAVDAGIVSTAHDSIDGDVRLDAGSFAAWLLRQDAGEPVQVTPKQPDASRAIDPISAATWMAFGEIGTPYTLKVFLARVHLVGCILHGHYSGDAVLDPGALALAHAMLADEERLTKARDELDLAVRTRRVKARSAEDGRALRARDMVNPIWLDVVAGEFVADPSLRLFSAAWDRASRAARRIGPILLSGAKLKQVFGRSRSNWLGRARAADALRRELEIWRRNDGPKPKRVDWVSVNGLGSKLAGSPNAAGTVWAEVTRDPVYAEVRHPGRRPGATKKTGDETGG